MDGRNLIGFNYSAMAEDILKSFSPALQQFIDGQFHIASPAEVEQAMQLASEAAIAYQQTSGAQRAVFLRAIADEIMNLGDVLIERAGQESGLPPGRLRGERGRTVGQLRLFADVAEEGSWVEASIDHAIPDRKPIPKADIRRQLVPLGPVVVFTASNFPLAFSTAGGDTASALAAGCPVIVKAHEAHLGTNALVALAIQRAAQRTGMPNGVFSSLNGTGPDLGQRLVLHPLTKAVAFTGSLGAGKAIFDAAGQRPEPIPVFAEMGSTNPVILCDAALQNRSQTLAKQYAGSVTLGVGQFCTNPGLLIAKQGKALNDFVATFKTTIEAIAPATMLNEKVCQNYERGKQHLLEQDGISLEGEASTPGKTGQGSAAIASVKAADFIQNPSLKEEVFGPFSLLVRCQDDAEMLAVVQSLPGQLTATLMGEAEELPRYKDLIAALRSRVGRLIFNGVPTGVEVCHSMHHGGPFPATTDARFTSVGTQAIKRFARPLAFQDCPDALLPEALQESNPTKVWRTVDGIWTPPN